MHKRYVVSGWVILAVLAALLLWRPWAAGPSGGPGERGASSVTAPEMTPPRSPSHSGPDAASVPRAGAKKKGVSKEERARYERAIRDALSARAKDSNAPDPPEGAEPQHDPEPSPTPGEGLKDRSDGKLSGLMKDFQDDVMPLADECYTQALERDPALAGGLDLQFQIIGDQDVGGLVESVELQDSSDIQDAEMIECMRETLLSTIFPAPDDSGATGVQLSLRFAPDDAAG